MGERIKRLRNVTHRKLVEEKMVKGSYRERTERGKVKESRALVNMGC